MLACDPPIPNPVWADVAACDSSGAGLLDASDLNLRAVSRFRVQA